MTSLLRIPFVLLLSACVTESPVSDVSEPTDPELPPEGDVALRAWLAEGHFLAWACEPEPHPARPPGAHGSSRVCNNAALSASLDGAFPVGAAAVKELYSDGALVGYAVSRKLALDATRASWYWYEAYGDRVVADARGAGLCASCHEDAPRDHVFTHVRQAVTSPSS